jgi:hypothetical protein
VTWGIVGALVALGPGICMWGFTVDDALISIRYAENVAAGLGYRFDPAAPPSDGVTPLPWVPVLALLAKFPRSAGGAGDALALLDRARVLGLLAWTAASVALAVAVRPAPGAGRWARAGAPIALGLLALAFPVGAWASSGMETGLVTALATAAALALARPRAAAALGGAAAAFRPELLPWALVVATGAALGRSGTCPDASSGAARTARAALVGALVAAAPFAFCVVTRLVVFGRPAPLAVLAKPSDLEHGLVYAAAAGLVVLLPLAAASPVGVLRAGPRARTLALAAIAHAAAIALVGGDWMPYARLVVPVVPSLALVVVDVASVLAGLSRLARVAFAARASLAFALGVTVAVRAAPAGRGVMRDRAALVARARPVLADARVVAALDIGWVSAATPAGIVDLAGLTDPTVAALRGGHTSKRVDLGMLEARDVDTVVVYEPPRAVEERLLRTPRFASIFARAATLPLGEQGARYVVYRRAR